MMTTMPWRDLADPDNIENRNAGNGGDLVKHTVYLAVLHYLLARSPTREQLRVRECHAGRGMYPISRPDSRHRRPLLTCLFDPADTAVGVQLHDFQRATQAALEVWPASPEDLEWYSGSVVLNAWMLGHAPVQNHLLDLYEKAPDTRAVLRAVLRTPALERMPLQVTIRPEVENEPDFDGEEFIERNIGRWDERDLILLDPFAIWSAPADADRRDRYRRILDSVIAHGERSSSLILFWTWGRSFPAANADLGGDDRQIRNGYYGLRAALHAAGCAFIRVRWRWSLQFAMWVLVPQKHVTDLRATIQNRCDQLTVHLGRGGCPASHVEVTIDHATP